MPTAAVTNLTQDQINALIEAGKILLIDKPQGWTSHDIVNVVRRKTGVRRVGHAGTLDPLATGVLIVLVGREATRLQDYFLHMDKSYEFTAELGKETDTFDSTGQVVASSPWSMTSTISRQQIESAVTHFVGQYEQQVPAYSAVKVDGQKLYALARQGKTVKAPTRTVEISKLELSRVEKNEQSQTLTFSCFVECHSGTYIRSLAADIGRKLEVGATVISLRRTRIGPFCDVDTQIWEK